MANDQELLDRLLIQRGLLQPNRDLRKEILDNDEMLATIAGLATNNEKALQLLVQSRIHDIKEEIVAKIHPAELLIYRQAMIEVALLFDDALKYKQEYDRRVAEKEGTGTGGDTNSTDNAADNGGQTKVE